MPSIGQEKAILAFLDLYYPIGSAVILIALLPILFFFRKAKIETPLLFLALSMLFTFFGDMCWTYYTWNGMEYGIIGILSDFLYMIEYIFITIGFYLFSRRQNKE